MSGFLVDAASPPDPSMEGRMTVFFLYVGSSSSWGPTLPRPVNTDEGAGRILCQLLAQPGREMSLSYSSRWDALVSCPSWEMS